MSAKQAGPFAVVQVVQRDNRFFICSIPASQLAALCGGLSCAPTRSTSPDVLGISTTEDVRELVSAIESSAFGAEVKRVQSESYQEEEPYQRLLDRTRAKAIAGYLQGEDVILPNGIILAANDGVDVELADGNTMLLKWDDVDMHYPLNIIDGQHRVEGLKILVDESPQEFAEFGVPAALLIDLPFYAQAELFAVINGEQKKVNKSQIFDLLGYRPIADAALKGMAYRGEMAIQRFCHHAVKVLNTSKRSPWENMIKMRGSGGGVVTQAALVDHLAAYCSPKKDRPGLRYAPVLFSFFKDGDLVGISRFLLIYFIGIKEAKPSFWGSEAALRASLFGKTNGIVVLFAILHDLVCIEGGVSRVTVGRVADHWRKVSDQVIASPPRGGSKGYQKEVIAEVLSQMFDGDAEEKVLKGVADLRGELKSQGALI